ncbi:MAG: hypothetical protein KTR25_17305 [Myxococcales bacterium]|nr:hypothetical protein [Myxococcales bacterium]
MLAPLLDLAGGALSGSKRELGIVLRDGGSSFWAVLLSYAGKIDGQWA